jgi:hypothetical protein
LAQTTSTVMRSCVDAPVEPVVCCAPGMATKRAL